MWVFIDEEFARVTPAKFARDFFFFALGSETFLCGRISPGSGRVQFAPLSFPLIFSSKRGMAGKNTREAIEDLRQRRLIHDQSLAEHKDAVLYANTWESFV